MQEAEVIIGALPASCLVKTNPGGATQCDDRHFPFPVHVRVQNQAV